MKKLIIVTIIAAFFAACNNTPAVSASAAKVAGLTKWVDSVKGLATAATTFDSATWATWDAAYNAEMTGINETELDEATMATLTTTKSAWAEVGTMYSAGIQKAKDDAKAAMDTTKVAPMAEPMMETPKK